jgi:steroid 5-alpha reductase family enzyme
MYQLTGATRAQRLVLAVVLMLWAVIFCWLLLGGAGTGDPLRRDLLAAAWCIYCLRVLLAEWIFLKRGIGWAEALTIAVWISIIALAFAILGGGNRHPMGIAAGLGVVLYASGSFVHTYSELRRYLWKQRPENHGRLYTGGLFHYAVHINYFGDLVLFTGFSLMTGSAYTLFVPAVMLAGFMFANIPALDAHLRAKYGAAFDAYAAKTKKLIPLVY